MSTSVDWMSSHHRRLRVLVLQHQRSCEVKDMGEKRLMYGHWACSSMCSCAVNVRSGTRTKQPTASKRVPEQPKVWVARIRMRSIS